MSQNGLVSIVVPCYNAERYVHRFLDSVLRQTYSPLELIFVNDGSTDGTETVVMGYRERFEKQGIGFCYLVQDNAGQAAAVNRGLKEIHGEFLMCSDSDDWLSDDCVEKKVAYLQANPEKMIVLGKAAFVDEKAPDQILRILQRKNTENGWLFEDLLMERDIYFAPGCYLVRTHGFLETHHGPNIYEGQGGQNWQLLLPVLYKYECGFLEDILYYIVIHQDSHCRAGKRYEQHLARSYEHEDILTKVVADIDMPDSEKQKYLRIIRAKYHRVRMHLAWEDRKCDAVREQYRLLSSEEKPDLYSEWIHFRATYPMVERLIAVVRIPWRWIVKMRGN